MKGGLQLHQPSNCCLSRPPPQSPRVKPELSHGLFAQAQRIRRGSAVTISRYLSISTDVLLLGSMTQTKTELEVVTGPRKCPNSTTTTSVCAASALSRQRPRDPCLGRVHAFNRLHCLPCVWRVVAHRIEPLPSGECDRSAKAKGAQLYEVRQQLADVARYGVQPPSATTVLVSTIRSLAQH
jgi:hypothetical protein